MIALVVDQLIFFPILCSYGFYCFLYTLWGKKVASWSTKDYYETKILYNFFRVTHDSKKNSLFLESSENNVFWKFKRTFIKKRSLICFHWLLETFPSNFYSLSINFLRAEHLFFDFYPFLRKHFHVKKCFTVDKLTTF